MKPSEIPTIVVDTREPALEAGDRPEALFRPWVYAPGTPRDTPFRDRPRVYLPTRRAALDVGDYSLEGLTHRVAIERKGGYENGGHDLLNTLFGTSGLDSVGEAQHNIERFRRELERARGYDLFAIVVEGDEGGVFREAQRRFERHGKAYDPEAVTSLLSSFFVDLRVPVLWCSWAFAMDEAACAHCMGGVRTVYPASLNGADVEIPCEACGATGLVKVRRQLMSAKERAELAVGRILTRVWSQAVGGEKARGARRRGYTMPWLDALAAGEEVRDGAMHVGNQEHDGGPLPLSSPGRVQDMRAMREEEPREEPQSVQGTERAQGEAPAGTRVADRPEPTPQAPSGPRFTPLGGMTASTQDAAERRARKRNPGARRGRSWSRQAG